MKKIRTKAIFTQSVEAVVRIDVEKNKQALLSSLKELDLITYYKSTENIDITKVDNDTLLTIAVENIPTLVYTLSEEEVDLLKSEELDFQLEEIEILDN